MYYFSYNMSVKSSYSFFHSPIDTWVAFQNTSMITKAFIQPSEQETSFSKQRLFWVSAGNANLKEISIGDSIFTNMNPRYSFHTQRLLEDNNYCRSFVSYSFGSLTSEEMDAMFSYFGNKPRRFDFWSSEYRKVRGIYRKYREQLSQPELMLRLNHVSGAADSSVVLVYKPNSSLNELDIRVDDPSNVVVYDLLASKMSSTLGIWVSIFLLTIFAISIIHRALVFKKVRWLEVGLCVSFFFPSTWFIHSLWWANLLGGFTSTMAMVFAVALVCTIPKPLSTNRIWKYIFILIVALVFWFRGEINLFVGLFGAISLFVIFIIQLLRQKGLQRRIMGRWFSLGFIPVLIFILFVLTLVIFMTPALKLLKHFGIHGAWLYQKEAVNSLRLDFAMISLFMMSMLIPFISPLLGLIFGMLELRIQYYYRLRRWITGISVFGVYLTFITLNVYFGDKLLTRDFFELFFLLSVGIVISYFIMKAFKFLDPVRHDVRRKTRELLEKSFGYQVEREYFQFYQDFIHRLYSRTNVTLLQHKQGFNIEQFILPSPEMLSALPSEGYFNLDLARINKHPLAQLFPEWIPPKKKKRKKTDPDNQDDHSKSCEGHLIFTLFGSDNSAKEYLLFGESGKLYWDKENADFIAETVQIFASFLHNIRLNESYREEQVKLERERQERVLEAQLSEERKIRNQELEEINHRIMDSINYASLIQRSILPNDMLLEQHLKRHFIIWKPRDIVGGDYYWFYPIPDSDTFLFAVIDCTGHGVPGAFMTLMTNSILNSIVKDRKIISPDKIISELHKEVRFTLQQGKQGSMNDGLDIGMILLDPQKKVIRFAGAKHKLLYHKHEDTSGELQVFPGFRHSIGGNRTELIPELIEIEYQALDKIYLLTDGIIDQPVLRQDGCKRRIFRDWVAYFYSIVHLDIHEQKNVIESLLTAQLLEHEQLDDITVVAIEL